MSKLILFQGDSITDSLRSQALDVPPNQELGYGYVNLTASELLERSPEKEWQIYNKGISGHRIVDLYARWKRDALNLKPAILSILIGVNDTWHEMHSRNGVELDRFELFYRMLLEWTRKELPETKIILLEPYVLPFGAVEPNWIPEMAERSRITEKMSKEFNTAYVPLQSLFNDALKRAPQEYWLKDGVHPTLAGHKLISNAWLKAAEPYLQ